MQFGHLNKNMMIRQTEKCCYLIHNAGGRVWVTRGGPGAAATAGGLPIISSDLRGRIQIEFNQRVTVSSKLGN